MQSDLADLAAQSRTAFIFVDRYGHRRDYTLREVADQGQRYAAVLRAIGVKARDRVAMCNANTNKCLFIINAFQRLGATPVYLPQELDESGVADRIKDAGAAFVVTNRHRRAALDWLHGALPPETVFLLVGDEAEGWVRIDTLADAATPFTGEESIDVAEDAASAAALLHADVGDRVWSTIPFADPEWFAFVQAVSYSGACTILHEGSFRAEERIDLLYELRPTILVQPAREYEAILAKALKLRLPALRRCIAVEGSAELAARWEQQTGKPLLCATFA